jgi:phosphatidate cytidylyltransferase
MAGQAVLIVAIFALVVIADVVLEVIRHQHDSPLNIYRLGMTLAGLIYAGFPPAFLLVIRALPDGLLWIYLIFAITWGTDTLAYFGGRLWGKHPLAPRISPKKTREGAVVGVIGGALLGLLVLLVANRFSASMLPLLIIGPPIAVVGDLFESRLKRIFQVGDSHLAGLNIIPGHGGVMDRTDALIWVTTFCYIYFRLIGLGL